MTAVKKGLGSKGKGIEALISGKINDLNNSKEIMSNTTIINTDKNGGTVELDINIISPNREQPRKRFDETALEELASSIKEYGVIQPVIVTEQNGFYEIVAGERRWRAAKIAGLKTVPAIIKNVDKSLSFELALVENLQRENLNPIEEANGYKLLIEEYGYSQEQLSEKVGKNRSTISNIMRLLNLDKRVIGFVSENRLSSGHAKALIPITDGDLQFELAETIIEEELSVRVAEKLVKKALECGEKPPKQSNNIFNISQYKSIEDDLKTILGTKVKLSAGKNKGRIEIEYYSDDDLDRIISLFKEKI